MDSYQTQTPPEVGSSAIVLPLDLAFIRWSVVHRQWHELANDMPLLHAFLAGWCCRCIGASQPADIGTFRDSFRVGWREADEQVTIASRQNDFAKATAEVLMMEAADKIEIMHTAIIETDSSGSSKIALATQTEHARYSVMEISSGSRTVSFRTDHRRPSPSRADTPITQTNDQDQARRESAAPND